jgi:mannose-6-phosphate isomerase-like protein (cupin superfamily)
MSKRIHLLALARVIGLSLLASACGGSNSDSRGSGSQNNPDLDALVDFSACMRQHGLPNFPDPKAGGGGYSLSFGSENGIDPHSAQFKNAQQTCKKLLPNGGTANSQEQAKQLQEALKYARRIMSLVTLDGVIGGHEAASRQLLVVLSGRVVCATPEEPTEIGAGEAVELHDGEWQETRSLEPARLLIVEGHSE